jgi:IS5 family transposase
VRLLILKHARNWSYAVLEREVRANLIYRKFARIGFAKAPDAKTMGKWGLAVGPEVIKEIHERIVGIAKEKGIAQGQRCASTPPWLRPTSTIPPTALSWVMGSAC